MNTIVEVAGRSKTKPPHTKGGLRFSTDQQPGIRRRRFGRGFRYLAPDDRPIRDSDVLARIHALAVPPALASPENHGVDMAAWPDFEDDEED